MNQLSLCGLNAALRTVDASASGAFFLPLGCSVVIDEASLNFFGCARSATARNDVVRM